MPGGSLDVRGRRSQSCGHEQHCCGGRNTAGVLWRTQQRRLFEGKRMKEIQRKRQQSAKAFLTLI